METRTAEEVIAYTGKDGENSLFGFDREALLEFLTFEEAKPWLKPEASGDNWPEVRPRTRESAVATLTEYMLRIGLDKAISHRGISAGRTIEKIRAWSWLARDAEAVRICDETPYPNYGAPILVAICKHFEIATDHLPDDDQRVLEAMARGEVCPDCKSGRQSGCWV